MRDAAREVGNELARAVEQAAKLARQAGEDLARLMGDARAAPPSATPRSGSPADMIRELGRLRDEGLITDDEFQTKKADLLGRL